VDLADGTSEARPIERRLPPARPAR
jgi:hypothetical protein